MIYIDGAKAIGGGIGRYIQEISVHSDIYDYIIGDKGILSKLYDENKIISKEDFIRTLDSLTEQDIIHFPANVIESFPITINHKYKVVVTIHDIIPFYFRQSIQEGYESWFASIKKTINVSDLIFTDSINSKKDLINVFHVDEKKIVVTYCGVSNNFQKKIITSERVLQFSNSSKKIVLMGGSLLQHKNFKRMLIASLLSKNSRTIIIQNSRKIRFLIKLFHLEGRISQISNVSDAELIDLYNLADVFLFVSLYEGFGLPVLESLMCGTPVIVDRNSSIPEVAGDKAFYTNGRSIISIKNEINDVISKKPCVEFNLPYKFTWQSVREVINNHLKELVE